MKIAMMLLVCGLSTGLAAQKELRSYTSPDDVFRFQYSREPIARFTKEDQAEVDRRLREALQSFRFLR